MPCSPGMTACKASCAHRAFVEGYRAERQRQMSEVVEQARGYATEIADIERQRREAHPRGRAYPTFNDWLVQNRRTMAMEPGTQFKQRPETPIYANGTAERTLLSHALAGRRVAMRAVLQLHPNEFQQSIHREVAVAFHELFEHQESMVLGDTADQVENYLREHGVTRTLEWDSTLPLGDRPQWQFGLVGWVDQSGMLTGDGVDEVNALAAEIRKNSRAQGLDNIARWSEQALERAANSPEGLTIEDVADVEAVMHQRSSQLRPKWELRSEVVADIHADRVLTLMPYGDTFAAMQFAKTQEGRSRG